MVFNLSRFPESAFAKADLEGVRPGRSPTSARKSDIGIYGTCGALIVKARDNDRCVPDYGSEIEQAGGQ
jgi:hypothetical protein